MSPERPQPKTIKSNNCVCCVKSPFRWRIQFVQWLEKIFGNRKGENQEHSAITSSHVEYSNLCDCVLAICAIQFVTVDRISKLSGNGAFKQIPFADDLPQFSVNKLHSYCCFVIACWLHWAISLCECDVHSCVVISNA